MILKTTTNEFCFINVSFYETIADPRHFFEQEWANEVSDIIMSWINSDGRGVIRNISQKQNYARC